MTIREATTLQQLLAFLVEGDDAEQRQLAEDAAAFLAGRAHAVLGAGPTASEARAAFQQTFPPAWWIEVSESAAGGTR